MPIEMYQVRQDIFNLKQYWLQRNVRFKSWYEFLVLVDQLASKGMETYVSNEPMTFYNMSHYLLTKGAISHTTPIENESALELDRKAKVHRGCEYLWRMIDRERQLAGGQPFIDELSFFLLVVGWYSTVSAFDQNTGMLQTQVWNPHDVYPRFNNNRLSSCVHSYKILEEEAVMKAQENGWNYTITRAPMGEVTLDDYFIIDREGMHNVILINGMDVTGWVERPNMQLLVAPVGGFPDKGSLTPAKRDWRRLAGRGIFEVNEAVATSFNKWKSMVSQILRDTAQPITQEFSASPQATIEELRARGALFHYAPGEMGLQRVAPPAIPIEVQANILELRREMQKGSFNDSVYGMIEGSVGKAAGSTLSLMATSSANQILYPYMDAKHFVIGESDRFWLSNLKSSGRVFQIKGKFIEKLFPTDIPKDVSLEVDSDVATPRDWLQRGTVANMLEKHLDEATIVTEILKQKDPQAIRRRKDLDQMLNHPMSQMVKLIAGYHAHADYLDFRGDMRQAGLFRRAAQAMESQLGAPPKGQGQPQDAARVEAQREAGAPAEKTKVGPEVAAPGELGGGIGRGSLRAV